MSVQKLVLIEGDAVAKFQFQNSSTNIYYYPRIIRASPYCEKEEAEAVVGENEQKPVRHDAES